MAAWKKWALVLAVVGFGSGCTNSGEPGYSEALSSNDEACVPVSCWQLGRFCGTTADGCGGTVDCGTCGNGGACNEVGYCCGGPSDPCAPPLHAGGNVEFALVRNSLEAETFNSVDADLMGNIFAIRSGAANSFLEHYSSDSMKGNKAAFSIDLKRFVGSVSVAPTLDRAYVSSVADMRSLAAGSASEMVFKKDGTQLGTVQNFSGDQARGLIAVGFTNNRAFLDTNERLVVRDANDRLMFEMDEIPVVVNDAAFDIDGNVFVVGQTTAYFQWRDTSWNQNQPMFIKFNRAGDVLWARNLNVRGAFREVSVTPNGYAVTSGTFTGGFTFADVPLESRETVSGMVLGFDPDGADRWAIGPGQVLQFPRVAMDQTGTAFIAFDRPGCGQMEVMSVTFKGQLAWRETFNNEGCTAENRITGLTAARGSAVIVGRFTGTFDVFNTEVDAAAPAHAFLIKFK